MDTASQVEVFLADLGSQILVASDTGSLKGFRGDLLDLVRNDVDDIGEIVSSGFLSTDIVDSDFGIWDTSVVTRLGIRLSPANAVASGWSTTHFYGKIIISKNN